MIVSLSAGISPLSAQPNSPSAAIFETRIPAAYQDHIRQNQQTDNPTAHSQSGWMTVHFEDFENPLSDTWALFDLNDNSGFDYWQRTTCHANPRSGNYTAWCAANAKPACGLYDNDMEAYLVYGPFSLEDANDAGVDFYYVNQSEPDYDTFGWAASIDGTQFHGHSIDGTTSGFPANWLHTQFDLKQVPTLGDLCGRPQVWIAFIFHSDNMYNFYEGAFLDDVTIQKYVLNPRPDLIPFQPDGWDDALVIAASPDTTVSSPAFYDDDTLFIDFSCINSGLSASGPCSYSLWLDGSPIKQIDLPAGLEPDEHSFVLDAEVGPLPPGPHTFTIKCDPGNVIEEADESNNNYTRQIEVRRRHGEIQGTVWHDLNKNAIQDANETGLAGWRIYLDLNQNCMWDSEEPNTLSGPQGRYHLTGLLPGSYTAAEVLQMKWEQTFPRHPSNPQAVMAPASSVPATFADALPPERMDMIVKTSMDSPPRRPQPIRQNQPAMTMNANPLSHSAVLLDEVPTSTWTFGCSATAAGMIFGYYDRNGYINMYTGPANNGIAPLTDLGQGIDEPIPGSCSLIATMNGFDGRITPGHVDDYWLSNNSNGPDPWMDLGTEHPWGDCVADFMGTNQWKWDIDSNGANDNNIDGATLLYTYSDNRKLYDFIPPSDYGAPQTALCHGLRLFAESRGYQVLENFSQRIAPDVAGGFSFDDYMSEIDAGRPLLIQLYGHTMVGVGYEAATQTVFVHDTWTNTVESMTWGGEYLDMSHFAVTVLRLAPTQCPGIHEITLQKGQILTEINFGNYSPGCGEWGYYQADFNRDCYVNLEDFHLLCEQWLYCSDPGDDDCTPPAGE